VVKDCTESKSQDDIVKVNFPNVEVPFSPLSLILLLAAIAISFRSAPFLDFVDYDDPVAVPGQPGRFRSLPA